ncbi:hypothetical protein EX30DRAFT_311070 [Ascodesmis nigricans]|uniref:Actin-like ATPase domain-containing protein n=1 Tax=Ascodesmis nigricans TaxID=341454 RepID=A0A4S2ML53_9PEZI|nr:hypothetical protein EX30DRAFT_311070 [Ascodesmis nigricans]
MSYPDSPPAYTEAAKNTVGGSSTEKKEPTFVIGVDFGTTFSSVIWTHSSCPDMPPQAVQQWPGQSADQVPTELQYTNASTSSYIWGYQIKPTARQAVAPLKCTTKQRTPADDTADMLTALGVAPVTVVTHFLKSIRDTTIDAISSTILGQEFIRQSKMLWVLTIPAIWSDMAKNLMIEAAENAGFGRHREDFHFVSEPEAGAVYTLATMPPQGLQIGDSFVILDCGGGTVDLITYKIRTLNPLTIDECVAGTGDLCGSVFLDQGFEKYIRGKLGDAVIDKMSARSRMHMMNSWITDVKNRFGGTTQTEFEVSVPGVADDEKMGVESGFHVMKASDVQAIFDPIIDRCIALTRTQITSVRSQNQRVTAVLLVGGFGSSAYLRTRLLASNLSVEVLQPTNAHTAIARGALLRGLDGSIVSTHRVRRWYGCSANDFFNSSTHDVACSLKKFWSTAEEDFLVPGYMTWYVKKNDTISDTMSISFPFYRKIKTKTDTGEPNTMRETWVFKTDLLACDTSAPDFKWRNPGEVYTVCQLESDLSGVPKSRWQTKRASGSEWWVVQYDLRMRMESEVLVFELVVDGKSYGAVRMRFRAGAEREVEVKN